MILSRELTLPQINSVRVIVIIKRVRYLIRSDPGEPTPILPGGALDIHGTEAAAGVVAAMLDASR